MFLYKRHVSERCIYLGQCFRIVQHQVMLSSCADSLQVYVYMQPWRSPGNAPIVDPCGLAGGAYMFTCVQTSFLLFYGR